MKFILRLRFIAFVLALIFISAFATIAHDYFLLPAEFFLKKGDEIKASLLVGNQFKDLVERKYQSSMTKTFSIRTGKKPNNLTPLSTDSLSPILTYKTIDAGLHLIEMSRNESKININKDEFMEYLAEEGLLKIQDSIFKLPKLSFIEKQSHYLKSLVNVDKPIGNVFNEKVGHTLEIILNNNPYKMNYGDDVSASIIFKDKPLKNTSVKLIVKSGDGKVHYSKLNSDIDGNIYFKVNREGTYLVRLVYMQASKDKEVDFESWLASYSFAFKLNI